MRKICILLFIAVLVSGSVSSGSSSAKPLVDSPATTDVADADAQSGAPFRIGSDGLGVYSNRVNSVSSIVQGIGDWVLDTKPSTLRKVRIDLGDPAAAGGTAPFQAAVVPVRFISKCGSWGFFMPGMSVGQKVNCPLAVSIVYNGTTYALRSNENYGGTESVQWTCLARNSAKCVSWEMIPSVVQADGQLKVVMQLLKPATKPHDAEQLLGQYYMSFDIRVTTP